MAVRKVLIIDDDRLIHIFLKAVLEKNGYKVSSALDSMQGVMLARQAAPDVIVLDMAMPGGGGAKVFERLRAMSSTTSIPILIYTTAAKDEVVKQVPEGPDVAFLAKPASHEEIVAAVAKLLAGA